MPINQVCSLIFCCTYFVELGFLYVYYKKKKNICKINDREIHFVEVLTFQHFVKTSEKMIAKEIYIWGDNFYFSR